MLLIALTILTLSFMALSFTRLDLVLGLIHKQILPEYKLGYEIFIWIYVLVAIAVFVQILSCHEWFVFDKKKYQGVPILGPVAHRFSLLVQNKRNIFNFNVRQITVIALIVGGVFVFLAPSDSTDLYGYMARGAQQAFFDLNPYHFTVSRIPEWTQEPLLANIHKVWAHNPSPYGPLYMAIYKLLAFLSMNNFYLALLLFKAFNYLVFAGLLFLMTRILNDTDLDKDFFQKKFNDARHTFSYKIIIYSLIALNPFIMVEALWNGHNDLLMGFLILLAIYLCYKNKFDWSVIVLTLSILAKYISVVFVPFVYFYIFTKPIKSFPFVGSIVSKILFAVVWYIYNPFAVNFNKISYNILLCHKSFQRTVDSIYKFIVGSHMPSFMNLVFLGLFLVFLVYLAYVFVKSENKRLNLFYFSFLALFALIFIASAKFHSWYLLMLLPLAVIIHPRLMIFLSISHLLSLTFLDQANIANFVVMSAIPCVIYFKYFLKQDL